MTRSLSGHRRRPSSLTAGSRQLTSPGLPTPVPVLRALWVACIVYADAAAFHLAAAACPWPHPGGGGGTVNVLVVADPQLPSMGYTYADRRWLLRWISLHIIHGYLRKAWRVTVRTLRPHAVVVLGDLLDGGVEAVDRRDYSSYIEHYRATFPSPPSTVHSPTPHMLHIAGNHDLGMYPDTTPAHSLLARERFISQFEPHRLHGEVDWGGWKVTWIDSIGLVEERRRGKGPGDATNFIRSLGDVNNHSRILFSHIPLFRPEGTSCGPLREGRPALRQGAGYNYQNEIDKDLTSFVFSNIQPTAVFSGDDHDYCEVVHDSSGKSIIETTVKSFSMAMGVRVPGYQLLTLSPHSATSPSQPSYASTPCSMPDQISLYLHFHIPLLVVTIVALVGPRVWRALTSTRRTSARTNGLPVHRHRKSLSRGFISLRRSRQGFIPEGSESDTEENIMTKYARSGTTSGIGNGESRSYHSPADSSSADVFLSMPSPASTSTVGGLPINTRRVSRLGQWTSPTTSPIEDIAHKNWKWFSYVAQVRKSRYWKRLERVVLHPAVKGVVKDFRSVVSWPLGVWLLIWLYYRW